MAIVAVQVRVIDGTNVVVRIVGVCRVLMGRDRVRGKRERRRRRGVGVVMSAGMGSMGMVMSQSSSGGGTSRNRGKVGTKTGVEAGVRGRVQYLQSTASGA